VVVRLGGAQVVDLWAAAAEAAGAGAVGAGAGRPPAGVGGSSRVRLWRA